MKNEIEKNMTHMTYGIYVLTTRHNSTINGMIASWVSQISYDPHLMAVAVHPNRYSHELMKKSGYFALNILARDQKELLARFKGPVAEKKFDAIAWKDGVTGCPVLSDGIGCFECRITQSLSPGNHTLFIGEVVNAVFNGENTPMSTLDYDGFYYGKA